MIIIEAITYNDILKLSRILAQVSNILICQFNQEFDDDDIDKKYIDMNYTDELNILIIILYFNKQKNKVS